MLRYNSVQETGKTKTFVRVGVIDCLNDGLPASARAQQTLRMPIAVPKCLLFFSVW